jgi:hypothetical protein
LGTPEPESKTPPLLKRNLISTTTHLKNIIMSNDREYAREHLDIVLFILRGVVELLLNFKNKYKKKISMGPVSGSPAGIGTNNPD